jgi:hypothetical protein
MPSSWRRCTLVFHIYSATKLERAKRTPFAKLDRRTKTLRDPHTRDAGTR